MASSMPVLTFHALDYSPAVTSFSPQVFQHGMSKLHDSGYQTLSLLEAVDYLHQEKPFPERSFVITFDDGYQSVFNEAFPVLKRYGMSATVFLTVGERKSLKHADRLPSFEGRSMLSWGEIREMLCSEIDFGAHTLTHPDLTRLPLEQKEIEIRESKAIIEDVLGTPVPCFAYPYGQYDNRTLEIVKRHFACACSNELGLINRGSSLYALKRIDAYYLRTDRLFNLMLSSFFPLYIRTRSIPRMIKRTFQQVLL